MPSPVNEPLASLQGFARIASTGLVATRGVRFTCRTGDRNKRESAKQDANKKAKISVFFFFVLFVTFVDKNPEFHRQSAG